jgi:predicted amidohydrolase YtcJ
VILTGTEAGDVRIEGGRIAEITPQARDGGGALLPGLWDHHLHLFALAARDRSVLLAELERAPGEGWVRAVGWDDAERGWLDRRDLDELLPDRPVRLQHRTGLAWVLNSLGVEELGLDQADEPGIERDEQGRPTGRLFGLDAWLADRLGREPPDLAPVGDELARYGITGVTDATPTLTDADLVLLDGLPQRVVAMGGPDLATEGPVKIVLADHALPSLAEVDDRIGAARRAGRAVAIHAASRLSLYLALRALDDAGAVAGDRIEHASVAPPDAVEWLADLGVTVVTQPHFVVERGDTYRREVEPEDQPWLHRGRGFLDAEVPLAAGSDAPFGSLDPWAAMAAAVDRRTASGVVLGDQERLTPEQALGLFLGPPLAPGGPPRRVAVGAGADLCLLDRPWQEARHDLAAVQVVETIVGGEVVFSA